MYNIMIRIANMCKYVHNSSLRLRLLTIKILEDIFIIKTTNKIL